MTVPNGSDRSRTFLHELARLLALVAQGRVHLSSQGHLFPCSLQALARQMALPTQADPSRSPRQAPPLAFALALLEHMGMIAPVGERFRLSNAAHDWLAQPATLQVQALREAWFQTLDLGWCWLPDGDHSSLLARRWRYVTLQALRTLTTLSSETWTSVETLLTGWDADGLLTWRATSQNLPQVRRSTRRRTRRLLRFLLCQILPRLALIETRQSPEQSQTHLRPTDEGVAWTRAALFHLRRFVDPPGEAAVEVEVPHHTLRFPTSDAPPVTLALEDAAEDGEPALALTLYPHAPAAYAFELSHMARLCTPGPPARYRVTLESVRRAAAWGYPGADVIFLLRRFCGQPLPPDAQAQLKGWQQETVVIPFCPGYRLRLAGPSLLEALRQREPFRRRTLPFPSGQAAWVDRAQARDLWRYLRRRGYAPQSETPDDADADPLPQPVRKPLPLVAWLALLRTYQALRQRLPGLADLVEAEPVAALEAALAPDDLAAAAQLTTSNTALLDGVLPLPERPTAMPGPLPEDDEDEDLKARLRDAVASETPLDLTYADSKGRVTQRRVRPLALETRWGQTYLVAFCELRQDERSFRLDRIVEAGAAPASSS